MTRLPQEEFTQCEPSVNVNKKLKRFMRLQLAYIDWLKTLGDPTHAVTLTFKRYEQDTKKPWSMPIIKKSTKVFLNILNQNAFGKHAKKNNLCIMSAVVIGTGTYNDHPHAHLALQRPSHLSWEEFRELILKTIKTRSWVDSEFTIDPYESDGWLEYMVDHGEEDLLIDLCTPARP
jgi:hypothetical protein